MSNKNVRQSNFELLRILSMLMIVGLHYFNGNMGGALKQQNPSDYNYYVTYFFESMLIVGVNCFVLITGFFQISKKFILPFKIFYLLILMIFYGLLFYFIAVYLGWKTFSASGMLMNAIPILDGSSWFIQSFIILYCLIPFLNIGLNNMRKNIFKSYLVLMLLLFSVYPSFLPSPPVTDRGYGIITFVLLYSLGAYIRKFYEINKTKYFYFNCYILCGFTTFAFSLIDAHIFPGYVSIVWGYNFIFNILGSLFLFLFFSKLNITSVKINFIANFTLGVYFVHTSPVLNDFIYETLLGTDKFWFSPYFILHAFFSTIFIYFVSTVIDIIRKIIFDSIGSLLYPYFKKIFPCLWRQMPSDLM